MQGHNVDVWQVTPKHVDLYSSSLPPTLLSKVEQQHTIRIDQLSKSHDRASSLPPITNTTFHNSYHSQGEIDDFLQQLTSTQTSHAATTLIELGHTAEGREMYGVKITSSQSVTSEKKKTVKRAIIISGAQHAREVRVVALFISWSNKFMQWIAPATALYIAHALVTDPKSPNSLANLLTDFVSTFVPSKYSSS